MNVEAPFPSVAEGCLGGELREIGVDEELVG